MEDFNLLVDNVEVSVIRKNIKHMYLRVKRPHAKVLVSVPMRMSQKHVNAFVKSKLDWIYHQQKKIMLNPQNKELEYVNNEVHYFLGKPYRLVLMPYNGKLRVSKKVKITKEANLCLFVKPNSDIKQKQRHLEQWYKFELENIAVSLIKKWEKIMNVKTGSLATRKMTSCWGTCNIKTKKILLNTELAKKNIACIEYVVVHEMVHLFERLHNARFYSFMDKFLPEWRELKKQLNGRDCTEDY